LRPRRARSPGGGHCGCSTMCSVFPAVHNLRTIRPSDQYCSDVRERSAQAHRHGCLPKFPQTSEHARAPADCPPVGWRLRAPHCGSYHWAPAQRERLTFAATSTTPRARELIILAESLRRRFPRCAKGIRRNQTRSETAIRREIALLTFRDDYRGAMGRPIISMRASMIFSNAPTIAAALSPKPLAARSFTSSFRMAA